MSAATAPTANGAVSSATEYVRRLSDEEKGHVLIALLRELIEVNGGEGLIPIGTREGESLGYFVPPKAAEVEAAAVLPKLTPERRAELDRRLQNLDSAVPIREVVAELRSRADAAQTRTP